jgi:hypothetical protein
VFPCVIERWTAMPGTTPKVCPVHKRIPGVYNPRQTRSRPRRFSKPCMALIANSVDICVVLPLQGKCVDSTSQPNSLVCTAHTFVPHRCLTSSDAWAPCCASVQCVYSSLSLLLTVHMLKFKVHVLMHRIIKCIDCFRVRMRELRWLS